MAPNGFPPKNREASEGKIHKGGLDLSPPTPLGVSWRVRATSGFPLPTLPQGTRNPKFLDPGGEGGGGYKSGRPLPGGSLGLNRPLRGRKNLKISPRGYFFQPSSICEVPGAPGPPKHTKNAILIKIFFVFFWGARGPGGRRTGRSPF